MFPGQKSQLKGELLAKRSIYLIFWPTNLIDRLFDIQIFRPEILDPNAHDTKVLSIWLK